MSTRAIPTLSPRRPSRSAALASILTRAVALSLSAGSLAQPSFEPSRDPASPEALAPLVIQYREHVTTLANPFFEGRAPGTNGNLVAADYLEFYFRRLGLTPAFPSEAALADGTTATTARATFRQPFQAGTTLSITREIMSYNPTTHDGGVTMLRPTVDFNTLAFGSSAAASGTPVFVGYSIAEGKDGYSSYPSDTDLSGKVAIVLRFEPMDADGKSRWASMTKWSPDAGLEPKLRAAAERGAAAIIMVNPPGADDSRTQKLEDINSVRPNGEALSIPVVTMSTESADALVRASDRQGRSLLDLRKLADESGMPIDLPNTSITIESAIARNPIMTDNVGAIVQGRGTLANEFVVIGAHYDHVGYGRFGSMDPDGRGKIHPGADDNASGTSAMLIIADRLKAQFDAMPSDANARSVLLMGFSAEESGLVGSAYYTRNMIASKEAHSLMINLDMVGRLGAAPVEVSGVGTAVGLEDWADPFLTASGLNFARKASGYGPSDHASFTAAGIPVLFFFTGMHDEYHRPGDVSALINHEGAVQIVDLVERLALSAALRPTTFEFVADPVRSAPGDAAAGPAGPRSTGVRFGIRPGNYATDVHEGVPIGAVMSDTPAEKGGLKAGDRIVKWNGNVVANVDAWMPLLGEHKPGDEVTITYIRDGVEHVTKVTLVGRDRRNQ